MAIRTLSPTELGSTFTYFPRASVSLLRILILLLRDHPDRCELQFSCLGSEGDEKFHFFLWTPQLWMHLESAWKDIPPHLVYFTIWEDGYTPISHFSFFCNYSCFLICWITMKQDHITSCQAWEEDKIGFVNSSWNLSGFYENLPDFSLHTTNLSWRNRCTP
jgi:hypothetical protein